MSRVLREIFESSMARLSQYLMYYGPPLIVAAVILLTAFLAAISLRWLILKAIKGAALDRFIRNTGLSSGGDRNDQVRAAAVLGTITYWAILCIGFLTAIAVFDTSVTSRIVEGTVLAIPRLLTAIVILLAGFWLSKYWSRGALVWAVNEGVPFARPVATTVRALVLVIVVVVAADTLNFAPRVFFAAFVIILGAVALTASITGALVLRSRVEQWLDGNSEPFEQEERSIWKHL
jgi:hypothetical protein